MPPVSQTKLSAAELATLDAWLSAGAPKSSETCVSNEKDAGSGAGDGTQLEPFDWSQCTFDVEFRAHNAQTVGDTSGYVDPLEDDHYECFNFAAPWSGNVQAINFESIIDDDRVVHHWILYAVSGSGAPAPGTHGGCSGNRTFIDGWAPGDKGGRLPDDIGMLLPPAGSVLQLEVHYNNLKRYSDVKDRSGVRVCATDKPREHTAAVHTLGSLSVSLPGNKTTSVSNTCTVASGKGDVHVMSASPHMHKLGVHMTTTVKRTNGTTETLIDTPFDFRSQGPHPTPMIVHQGDTLTTTCTWDNDTDANVRFGEGTGDEMCFNFVVAWPAGGLSSGTSGSTCIGFF
jgi:hypothetical protein